MVPDGDRKVPSGDLLSGDLRVPLVDQSTQGGDLRVLPSVCEVSDGDLKVPSEDLAEHYGAAEARCGRCSSRGEEEAQDARRGRDGLLPRCPCLCSECIFE